MRKVLFILLASLGLQLHLPEARAAEYSYFDLSVSCATCTFALPSSPMFLTTEESPVFTADYLVEAISGVKLLADDQFGYNNNYVYYG